MTLLALGAAADLSGEGLPSPHMMEMPGGAA